jgi:hypothetical protein
VIVRGLIWIKKKQSNYVYVDLSDFGAYLISNKIFDRWLSLGVVAQTGKMRHVMKAFLSTPQALSLE